MTLTVIGFPVNIKLFSDVIVFNVVVMFTKSFRQLWLRSSENKAGLKIKHKMFTFIEKDIKLHYK